MHQQQTEDIPDKCDENFDSAGFIRGNLMMFKNKYFWTAGKSDDATLIRQVWPELPAKMTKIDAVYEAADQRVWFIIGSDIFIFDGAKLVQRMRLKDIGIYLKNSDIQSMFRMPCDNQTYIISNDGYVWKFDGAKVSEDGPKKINLVWPRKRFELGVLEGVGAAFFSGNPIVFSDRAKVYSLSGYLYFSHKDDPFCSAVSRPNVYMICPAPFACKNSQILDAWELNGPVSYEKSC